MISFYLDEISTGFEVFGANEGDLFEAFEKGKIYDNILVRSK